MLNPVQYIVFAKNPCYQYFEGYALVAVDAGNNQIKYQVTKSPGTGLCNATGGYVLSTGTYPAYSWNHVVFYMDGQVIKLYVNGQLAGTTIAGGALNYDATKVYIGGTNYASYNYPLNGASITFVFITVS